MGVFLSFGCALAGFADEGDGVEALLIEDIAHGAGTAVAGADELQAADCGGERQRREAEQMLSFLDLAVFELQSIAFEGPEHLLDTPAQSIEPDGLAGRLLAFDRQGRQQAPEQGFAPGRWIADLAYFDQ